VRISSTTLSIPHTEILPRPRNGDASIIKTSMMCGINRLAIDISVTERIPYFRRSRNNDASVVHTLVMVGNAVNIVLTEDVPYFRRSRNNDTSLIHTLEVIRLWNALRIQLTARISCCFLNNGASIFDTFKKSRWVNTVGILVTRIQSEARKLETGVTGAVEVGFSKAVVNIVTERIPRFRLSINNDASLIHTLVMFFVNDNALTILFTNRIPRFRLSRNKGASLIHTLEMLAFRYTSRSTRTEILPRSRCDSAGIIDSTCKMHIGRRT
jgi:hypothetical protein